MERQIFFESNENSISDDSADDLPEEFEQKMLEGSPNIPPLRRMKLNGFSIK